MLVTSKPSYAWRPEQAVPPTDVVLVTVWSASAGEEVTNAGGEHYVMRGVIAGKLVALYAGGHSVSLGLYDIERRDVGLGRWFLAEARMDNSPEAQIARANACASWRGCNPQRFDGDVIALVPTASAQEAELLHAQRLASGSPGLGPLAERACVFGEAPYTGWCPIPGSTSARKPRPLSNARLSAPEQHVPPTDVVLVVLVTVWSESAGVEVSNGGGEHYVMRGEINGKPVALYAGGHYVGLGLYDIERQDVGLGRWFLAEARMDNSPEAQTAREEACAFGG